MFEHHFDRPSLKKTPNEFYYEKPPYIGLFLTFDCKCFILNTKDKLAKFDAHVDFGIFLGYFSTS